MKFSYPIIIIMALAIAFHACLDEQQGRVTGISLKKKTLRVEVGKSATLSPTITPDHATNQQVNWSSSNENVAMVSNAGLVIGVAAGHALVIAAAAADPTKKDTAQVTVILPVAGITLSPAKLNLSVGGATATLKVAFTPKNASEKKVKWTSDQPNVAKVSHEGVVTAVASGVAVMTATSLSNPRQRATAQVTVTTPVTGIKVSPTSLNLTEGGTGNLTVVITPKNASNKKVTWTSNKKGVATVSAQGVVTAVVSGVAVISATSLSNPKQRATIQVIVKKSASPPAPSPAPSQTKFISGVDISRLPEIEAFRPSVKFYNQNGVEENILDILKQSGVNTIRLRLWVNPVSNHSGFAEVKAFAIRLRAKGFKIWITPHYSDTWAHPGQQATPAKWASLSFEELKIRVWNYTKKIVDEIAPEYIQIGNEINTGFLFPKGEIKNFSQFKQLLNRGVDAVRKAAPTTKIIMQYAGLTGADDFYDKIKDVSYDIIGLSYYPIHHGKDLNALKTLLANLSQKYSKDVVIAETSYPFTLGWNDWKNNVVGEASHLIPGYPPSPPATPEHVKTVRFPQAQKAFLQKIKEIALGTSRGLGFCYWGGASIAWKGKTASASDWENQALFDFNNRALPVLEVFKINR